MANIPLYYEQRTQTPDPSRAWDPRAHGNDVAGAPDAGPLVQAAGNVAHLFQQSQEEQARAWSADALSDAKLKWTSEYLTRTNAAQPGAPEFTPSILKDYDEYSSKLVETAPTRIAKKYLSDRLNEFRSHIGEKSMEFEARARLDYRTDTFTSAIDKTSKLMNSDPDQYKVSLAEVTSLIRSAAIPPIQKSALLQKASDQVSAAAVWSQIQKSPQAFLDSIGFSPAGDDKLRKSSGNLEGVTGNLAFDSLPFDKRSQMFEQAIRLKAQLDSDVERKGKEAQKALEQDSEKKLWGMKADGTLTRNAIENERPILSAAAYHSFLATLEKEPGQKSDPTAFRNIQKLLADGQYGEAEQAAFTAHRNGLLSNEHLASEVTRARTLDRQEGPKSEFERSRNYIIQSLDPGPLVHDPIGKGRLAEALDTYDRFNTSTKREDKDIEARAKEIVGQYRFLNLSDTVAGLPLPRSGSITRQTSNPNQMIKEIADAATEAQRRLDAGQYNDAEFKQEMTILNRWRKTIQGKK